MTVRESGYYQVSFRFATNSDKAKIELTQDYRSLTGVVDLPDTGSEWDTFEADAQFYLEEGQKTLRLRVVVGGVDLYYMSYRKVETI